MIVVDKTDKSEVRLWVSTDNINYTPLPYVGSLASMLMAMDVASQLRDWHFQCRCVISGNILGEYHPFEIPPGLLNDFIKEKDQEFFDLLKKSLSKN